MGGNARAAYLVRRLSVALCAALVVCVVGAVYAAGVDVNATSARYSGATSTGIRTSVTLEARVSGVVNGVKQYTTAVPLATGTLGNLAKGALRRGLGWYGAALMVKDLVNGAGWVIDELGQQVTDGVPKDDAMQPAGTRMYQCSARGTIFYSTNGASLAPCMTMNIGQSCSSTGPIAGGWWGFWCGDAGSQAVGSTTVTQPTADYGTGYKPRMITDTELGDLVKQSPQVINAILIDPETGAPIRTQELTDAINNLRKQLESANGIDPGPDAAPTTDPAAPQNLESDWPGFCNWAGVVCDFIDWVKDDKSGPEKELPEQELKIDPDSWKSGIGEGSCPSPQQFTITVAGYAASGEYSFQPLCDFSAQLKPFLIVVASVVAVMILAGLRSTNAK